MSKIRFESIWGSCRHRTKWSVRFQHPLRSLKRDLHSFLPFYRKYWGGAITHIGVNHFYMVIDRRKINSINDFVDEMKYPQISHILRKFRKSKP